MADAATQPRALAPDPDAGVKWRTPRGSMSRYLIDRIAAGPNTEVVSDTEVRAREDHRFEVAVALSGRVAIVTGGTRGIGRAMAEA